MKRLTIRNGDGSASQAFSTNWSEVFNKLADYEDSGLTPNEVQDIKVVFDMYGGSYGITQMLMSKDEWIDCKERLPKKCCSCNVVVHPMHSSNDNFKAILQLEDVRYVAQMYFDAHQQIWKGETPEDCYNADLSKVDKENSYYISHWKPLPELPPE